jgi:hypothetical protein
MTDSFEHGKESSGSIDWERKFLWPELRLYADGGLCSGELRLIQALLFVCFDIVMN